MNKVSIYGGLGNQMFQYAFCVALNQKGKKSEIDFSNYLFYDYHHGFDLGRAFKIKLRFPYNVLNYFLINCEPVYKNKIISKVLRNFVKSDRSGKFKKYQEREEFKYDANVFELDSSRFVGVWQVESYFSEFCDMIRKEFTFKLPRDGVNSILKDKIRSCNSVGIHIRRGDYIDERWKYTHNVLEGSNYYVNAVKIIDEKIWDPHYFVFSDDPEWVKANLKLLNATFVTHNKGKRSYLDMYLMSLCKHNIIANSTFSWWAAWLNNNENKIVIIPDHWLKNSETPGIYPTGWVRVAID
ncbi:MAG: alpha-1,2-fucosyltransferase [Chitinophagaceae bacterium]|nr:alpha-1,2-fucosyltransferase [Chitinophagaceae bacterium]